MKAKLNATDWLIQPEYRPMSPSEKHRVTKQAEAKFHAFIIGEEGTFEPLKYGQVRVTTPVDEKPSQITDEEILLSINRLADEFVVSVKELNNALGGPAHGL